MRRKHKKPSHLALPHSVLSHQNYLRLSSHAVKLLVDLGAQYNGFNNGDLCATWSMMEKKGWKSRNTLHKALNELLHYGLIIKTRQGGKHAASLYALTWQKIDECKGKLDVQSTKTPPGNWKNSYDDFKPKRRKKNSLPDTHREHIDTPGMSIH